MSRTNRRRYPGLHYFTEAEKDQFFGRDEEIEELLSLVLSEKIVVLYGKSGYGKSSLLRAGILPRLDSAIQPLLVQFGAYQPGQSLTPVRTTLLRVDLALPDDALETAFLEEISDPDTLWHRFKRKQTPEHQRFLLIFDQFEEFDSYPAEQKNAFKQQLAELLFTRIPQVVRDRSDALDDAQQSLLAKALDIKVLFAIREDRLSALDALADKLPAILHKRFRLQGLTAAQAREAVVKPAALQGQYFSSPRFAYSPAALDALLRGLKKEDSATARIEAFLLQICCENIEQAILERTRKNPADELVVTPDELPAFSRLFEEYYRDKVAMLALINEAASTAARRMIEDELIKTDPATGIAYRISVDGRQLTKLPGVDEALLKRLTDDFLLRSEPNTTGGFSYEVSHDRLVEGILNAKAEHESALAQAAAEQEAREEAERLRVEAEARERQLAAARIEAAREKRRRQRATFLAVAAVAGFLVAAVAGWWAFGKKNEAETATANALSQKSRADKERFTADSLRRVSELALRQAEKSDSAASAQRDLAEQNAAVANSNLRKMQAADLARQKAEREKQETQIAQMFQEIEVFLRADEPLQALDKVEAILALDPQNDDALKKKAAIRQRLQND